VRFVCRLRASTRAADGKGRARAGESAAGEGGTTTCGKDRDRDGGATSEDEVDDIDDTLGRVRSVRG